MWFLQTSLTNILQTWCEASWAMGRSRTCLQEGIDLLHNNQFVTLEHPHPIHSFHQWSSATPNGPKNPTGVNLGHTNCFGPKWSATFGLMRYWKEACLDHLIAVPFDSTPWLILWAFDSFGERFDPFCCTCHLSRILARFFVLSTNIDNLPEDDERCGGWQWLRDLRSGRAPLFRGGVCQWCYCWRSGHGSAKTSRTI